MLSKLPFAVDQIQTDNGQELGSAFHWHLLDNGMGHVGIRPRTPRLKRRGRTLHRTDSEEFYRLLEGQVIDDARLFNIKLQECEDYYNYDPPTAPSKDKHPTNAYDRKHEAPTPDGPMRAAGRASGNLMCVTDTGL